MKDAEGVPYYQVGSGEVGLLVVPDVWGWNGGRTRALADEFAKKGLSVFIPKILQPAFEGGSDGDGLPPDFDLSTRGSALGPLIGGDWNCTKTLPGVFKVIAAMKASGVTKYGCVGFCYGAWIGMHLSKAVPGDEMICGASPHPSVHIEGMVGGDPAKLAAEQNCPWALFPCGDPAAGGDGALYDQDGDLYKALEAKFPGQNMTKRYGKMVHGFVSRGAIKDGRACEVLERPETALAHASKS